MAASATSAPRTSYTPTTCWECCLCYPTGWSQACATGTSRAGNSPSYTPAAAEATPSIPEFDSRPLKTEATMLPDANNFATDGILSLPRLAKLLHLVCRHGQPH